MSIWVEDEPDARGRYGAALLFVRWSDAGDRPVGHVETPLLVFGRSREEAEGRLRTYSLYDVKAALDAAIAEQPGEW